MSVNPKNKYLNRFYSLIFIAATFLLLLSVLKSGLLYQYDNDELSHTQYAYLLRNGLSPYTSFIMTFTPLFHWFILPIFNILGFNFSAIFVARIIMIVLFLARITLSHLIVRLIFGKLIAYIFVPLQLLDPFTVFSAMQIRQDNLMITVFLLGLLLLGLVRHRRLEAADSLLDLAQLRFQSRQPGFDVSTHASVYLAGRERGKLERADR